MSLCKDYMHNPAFLEDFMNARCSSYMKIRKEKQRKEQQSIRLKAYQQIDSKQDSQGLLAGIMDPSVQFYAKLDQDLVNWSLQYSQKFKILQDLILKDMNNSLSIHILKYIRQFVIPTKTNCSQISKALIRDPFLQIIFYGLQQETIEYEVGRHLSYQNKTQEVSSYLITILSFTSESREYLMAVHTNMIKYLCNKQSKSDIVNQNILWALNNFTVSTNGGAIINQAYFGRLKTILCEQRKQLNALVRTAIWGVHSFTKHFSKRNYSIKQLKMNQQLIIHLKPILMMKYTEQNKQVLNDCFKTLLIFTTGPNQRVNFIMKHDIHQFLPRALDSGIVDIVWPAMRVIGNISGVDDKVAVDFLTRPSVIEKMLQSFKSITQVMFQRELVWIFGNIVQTNANVIQIFLQNGGINFLKDITTPGLNLSLQKQLLLTLSKLSSYMGPQQMKRIFDAKIFNFVIKFAQIHIGYPQFNEQSQSCLYIVKNFLKMSYQLWPQSQFAAYTASQNLVLNYLHETNFRETLYNTQYNGNKIYQISQSILNELLFDQEDIQQCNALFGIEGSEIEENVQIDL